MSEVAQTLMRPSRQDPANVSAVGHEAMISTSHPQATEAGLTALRNGGSAVDAYLAAAAVQTVVEPTMTSLGGGLAMNVYDPSTGQSHIVAGMNGMPAADEGGQLDDDAYWSGRTIVTPGWVSGAHAAWEKWGKLEWSDLFADAHVAARDGFVVDQLLWGTMWEYRMVPGMYQEGRDVWYPDGRLVCVGEVLRQPALARTIEQLAEQGPDFFYQGEFARHYVERAQAAGGRLTLDDMAATQQGSFELQLPPLPVANGLELHTSGLMYAVALNLASVGGLGERARPTEDAETLYLQMRVVEETWHYCLSLVEEGSGFSPEAIEKAVASASPESVEKLWPLVETGPPRSFDGMNLDTNAIVAVDDSGMVVHGTHSTSGTPFGVGMMVDGVVLTRPLYYFARPIVTDAGRVGHVAAGGAGRPAGLHGRLAVDLGRPERAAEHDERPRVGDGARRVGAATDVRISDLPAHTADRRSDHGRRRDRRGRTSRTQGHARVPLGAGNGELPLHPHRRRRHPSRRRRPAPAGPRRWFLSPNAREIKRRSDHASRAPGRIRRAVRPSRASAARQRHAPDRRWRGPPHLHRRHGPILVRRADVGRASVLGRRPG